MRWQGRRQSTNIRDVRGSGGFGGRLGGGFGGGMGRGGPFVVRRAGGGGLGAIIVIVILAFVFGINPLELISGGGTMAPPSQIGLTPEDDEAKAFVATVLADTEDTWSAIFAEAGEDYPEPQLTLFRGRVSSNCGFASAATGPFYCPADQNVYIDLGFFRELSQRFGAPGDFAQAYVLAHEVGHHVQNVLGILPQVHERQQQLGQAQANALSVKTELQADCLAGVWAQHTERRGLLDAGDIDEALTAASAVGDDTLQRQGQGYVVPDSFTHGTSEERATWFRKGYEGGSVSGCDTFAGEI